MSSFLSSSASITLIVLLSILSFTTAFDLVDTDGDPIKNGGEYYIIPKSGGGGLTYTHDICPHLIIQEKNESSPGTPVKIYTPVLPDTIKLDQQISLSFKGPTECGESLVWTHTKKNVTNMLLAKRFYITAGKDPMPVHIPFSITKTDKSLLPIYGLKYSISVGEPSFNVGLFEDDGLLGITTDSPTRVFFKKAFKVHLELPTS
ncbi:trypsin inhibitor DE-3-like [Silene latifolia]|uniref:trypsin inhibitor DE-3-like n=1 Tax=Silene latifolia TaxID=37657 RepID=UPI003D78A00E